MSFMEMGEHIRVYDKSCKRIFLVITTFPIEFPLNFITSMYLGEEFDKKQKVHKKNQIMIEYKKKKRTAVIFAVTSRLYNR